MRYVLKTKGGDYNLNFGNYFLQKLAKNKGVDYTKSTVGLFKEFAKLFKEDGSQDLEAPLTGFLDELVFVMQAAHQASNAEKGIFEKLSVDEWEFIALEQLGDMPQMFAKFGEIVELVVKSINPEGLGAGEPKQKKSQAAKRK